MGPIFPSVDDDVVTSPYNAMLTLNALGEHADCVIPMENQALYDITEMIAKKRTQAGLSSERGRHRRPDALGCHEQYSSAHVAQPHRRHALRGQPQRRSQRDYYESRSLPPTALSHPEP